jgi:hypothetical protein
MFSKPKTSSKEMRGIVRLQIVIALTTAALLGLSTNRASAEQNECGAKITFSKAVHEGGNLWVIAFLVKTECSSSSGFFQYEYELNQGGSVKWVTATAPNWTAGDGNNFFHRDRLSLSPGQSVGQVRVIASSIRSTRIKK